MASTLRDRRKLVGLTQRELAERAGCSRQLIRWFEGGYHPRRSPALERVPRVLAELEQDGARLTLAASRRNDGGISGSTGSAIRGSERSA